ncbi:MAG: glycosyltransferase [Ferruginibacter sp.]|nr:glycosyltransferase [Cytophagales bacterium]
MKTFQPAGEPPSPPLLPPWEGGGGSVSVVVVVRNEAGNIVNLLEDLNRQTYPTGQFEVIVVDDGSTDDTFGLVTRFVEKAGYPLRLFSLSTDSPALSPKKRGITEAIRIARGELIVTTDGDCRVGTAWLALIAHGYRDRRARLISGAVTFEGERNLLEKMQTVEFASLMGSGACALQWGLPTMCNGANLAYPKAVFEEVGGFTGIDHLASGDDELLMHKIARRYPGRIFFLRHPASVVRTRAQPTHGDLYQQRKRWASKWKAYRDWKVSGLAVFIFLSNLSLLVAAGSWAVGEYPLSAFLLQAWVKLSVEFPPLALFLGYLHPTNRARRRTALIPLVQLVYPFYVVFFGLAAQRKGFVWKGRKMR